RRTNITDTENRPLRRPLARPGLGARINWYFSVGSSPPPRLPPPPLPPDPEGTPEPRAPAPPPPPPASSPPPLPATLPSGRHIGHAKAICLDFGIAREFGGRCNLRFDDTNPAREDPEFVRAIQEDVRWLGFEWDSLRHASDYFEVYYLAAEKLIRDGKAYVCDLTPEQVREYRGTLTEPGRDSPCRNRSVEENLDLFRRMRAGEFPEGSRTLRAKIDMASGNINMRDPALYRIKHMPHPIAGDGWCIYPMYDFAH